MCLYSLYRRLMRAVLQSKSMAWKGWHGFRRGLATVLHDLGVDDLTIQAILRQADVATTRRCYIKTLPAQSIAAMAALENRLMDSNWTLGQASESATIPSNPSAVVN